MKHNKTYETVLKILSGNPGASPHILADKITRAISKLDDRVQIDFKMDQFEEATGD